MQFRQTWSRHGKDINVSVLQEGKYINAYGDSLKSWAQCDTNSFW